MAQSQKLPRVWYSYNGVQYLVPPQFVYRLHESKGGGFDINAAFFTWAFNAHGISIVSYDTIYSDQSNLKPISKAEKGATCAGTIFFAVACKGRDKRGFERVGVGEVGNESITPFQRAFPFGIASKRAKVSMGKEFFNLVDLKYATDCRDFVVDFGEYKDCTLAEVCKTDKGKNSVRWFASDSFNANPILKQKAQEVVKYYLDKTEPAPVDGHTQQPNRGNGNNQQQRPNNNPQTNNQPTPEPNAPANDTETPSVLPTNKLLTEAQKNSFAQYRDTKHIKMDEIKKIAMQVLNKSSIDWNTMTIEEGRKVLDTLQEKYGVI